MCVGEGQEPSHTPKFPAPPPSGIADIGAFVQTPTPPPWLGGSTWKFSPIRNDCSAPSGRRRAVKLPEAIVMAADGRGLGSYGSAWGRGRNHLTRRSFLPLPHRGSVGRCVRASPTPPPWLSPENEVQPKTNRCSAARPREGGETARNNLSGGAQRDVSADPRRIPK